MLTALTLPPVNLDPKTMVVTAIAVPVVFLILRKLRRVIVENFSYALDYVVWTIGRNFHQAFAKRVSLKRYGRLQLADAATRYLQVPGPRSVTLETDSIFVPLHFESAKQVPRTLTDALRKDGRITVIGEPGSGKSSLVKQTFREACRSAQWSPKRARLPIVVELKNFVPPEEVVDDDAAGEWALDKLRERVKLAQGFDMGRFFDSFLDGQGLLVLLDGLDEVASNDYKRTAMAIRGLSAILAQQSTKNALVLTMRSQFYEQVRGEIETAFPAVYRIAPFTPGAIFNFLERWTFAANRDEHISRIYSDLTDRPTLREMCRNPLVLSMYVANDQGDDVNTRVTPDTRTTFYDQVVGELVVERRSRQLGMAARGKLREDREQILGKLALNNLMDSEQAANSPSWKDAIGIYSDVYRCSSTLEAEEGLLELEKDTGIISHERSGESLRFIHLTFCEFLAAKEAALGQEDGFDDLLECHEEFQNAQQPQLRSRLNEVIPFAAALLPRFSRQAAVTRVAEVCGLEILGRCFLETQEYGSDVWQDYLDDVRSGLLQADPYQWTDDWLAKLHLFNVVLQDAEHWSEIARQPVDVDLETVFARLVQSDRERLVKLFSSYALNDPPAALRLAESCGVDLGTEYPELVIANCESPPFLAAALQRAEGWTETSKRWTALLAEAGLRRHIVALTLHGRDAPREFARRFSRIDGKRRWNGLPLTLIVTSSHSTVRATDPDRSAYAAILTLALQLPPWVRNDLPALGILSKVPPPGSAVSVRWIRLLAVTSAVGVFVLARYMLSSLNIAQSVLLIIVSAIVFLFIWLYPVNRRKRYAVLANLPPSYFVVSASWRESRYGGYESLIQANNRWRIIISGLRTNLDKVYLRRLNAALNEMRITKLRLRSTSRVRPKAASMGVNR
jgi:hypothetical protein